MLHLLDQKLSADCLVAFGGPSRGLGDTQRPRRCCKRYHDHFQYVVFLEGNRAPSLDKIIRKKSLPHVMFIHSFKTINSFVRSHDTTIFILQHSSKSVSQAFLISLLFQEHLSRFLTGHLKLFSECWLLFRILVCFSIQVCF